MPKIGVVGPAPSVERILSVATDSYPAIEFIPFSYDETREAINIVSANRHKVNGWLFSGPAPLMLARQQLTETDIAVSCFHVGASLYRSFLQMTNQLRQPVSNVSIDMIYSDKINEALAELQIPTDNMQVIFYDENLAYQDVFRFHRDAYRSGQTDGAITSLHAVYQALAAEGIPAYRNTPTKMEIRLAIQMIADKVSASYFKNTQVGLEIIEISHFAELVKRVKSPYQLQDLELSFKRILIKLSESLDGYLIDKGNGHYEVFSSRGAIEREIPALQDAIQHIGLLAEAPVSVGIGFGETVYTAEVNAHQAVYHAQKKNLPIVVIREDGVLIESAGEQDELKYDYASTDKKLLEMLNQAKVSIKTYYKIEAAVRSRGWDTFTVKQLAAQLSVTVRNINRIVTALLAVGLIAIVGEETATTRGRPSKLYQLT